MKTIEEPTKELYRIALLLQPELASTRPVNLLEKLVRTDLALEQSGIPHLLRQSSKSLYEFALLPTKIGQK
jgi:hypothetical protein